MCSHAAAGVPPEELAAYRAREGEVKAELARLRGEQKGAEANALADEAKGLNAADRKRRVAGLEARAALPPSRSPGAAPRAPNAPW